MANGKIFAQNVRRGSVKRLTEEFKGRLGIKTPNGVRPAWEFSVEKNTVADIIAFQDGINKLAEYEELEMSPEEIKELNDFEKSQISVLLKEKEKINEERKYWRNETLKLASKLREQRIERGS